MCATGCTSPPQPSTRRVVSPHPTYLVTQVGWSVCATGCTSPPRPSTRRVVSPHPTYLVTQGGWSVCATGCTSPPRPSTRRVVSPHPTYLVNQGGWWACATGFTNYVGCLDTTFPVLGRAGLVLKKSSYATFRLGAAYFHVCRITSPIWVAATP